MATPHLKQVPPAWLKDEHRLPVSRLLSTVMGGTEALTQGNLPELRKLYNLKTSYKDVQGLPIPKRQGAGYLHDDA